MLSQEEYVKGLKVLVRGGPASTGSAITNSAINNSALNSNEVLNLRPDLGDVERPVRELLAVDEISAAAMSLPGLEQFLAQFNSEIGDLLDVEKAGVMLFDPAANELVLQRPALGVDDDLFAACQVHLNGHRGESAATLILRKEPYLSGQSHDDPKIMRELIRKLEARSLATVPLTLEKRFFGVLFVADKRQGMIQQSDLRLLGLLASSLAALVKSARLAEREKQRGRGLVRVNRVISDQRDKLELVAATYEKLTRMVLHGNGVDGIARALAGLVENPVAVEDRFFQLICYAPFPTLDKSERPSLAEFRGTAAAALNDLRFREKVRLMKSDGRPVQLPPYPQFGVNWSRLIAAITAGKGMFGYVSVFEKDRQFSELDSVALEHAATVFALELQKQNEASEVEQRLKGEFLDDLLMGNYANGDTMLRRAAYLDYSLARPYVVMVVEMDPFGAISNESNSGLRGTVSIKKKLFEIVESTAGEMSPGSVVANRSDSVIALLNLVPDPWNSDRNVVPKEIADAVRREFSRQYQHLTLSIAISGKCERPEDCKRSYQIATKSLDIMKAFKKRDRIISFDRLGAYQLLLQIEDKAELKAFVDRLIGPLVAYDEKHNAALMETLESYLQNDCNLQKTARLNFVHGNTVKYRLQRIQEIGNIDLADHETRLDLQLGLKVWHLIK